jgi:hypothetical protein
VHTQERISEVWDRVDIAADKVGARTSEAFIGALEGEDLICVSKIKHMGDTISMRPGGVDEAVEWYFSL